MRSDLFCGEALMTKLLQIDSSPLGEHSASRKLTRQIVTRWQAAHPGTVVESLDLAAEPPAHLDGQALAPRSGAPESSWTDAQRRENEVTEKLLTQFLAADVVVIGAPMYNFSVPSQLKAWIDRIAQAGRTFRYTEKGPEGLVGGKTVVIASSRGGIYSANEAMAALEHQESYLRAVFGFLGVTDLGIVRVEGVAMGESAQAQAWAAAEQALPAAVGELQAA